MQLFYLFLSMRKNKTNAAFFEIGLPDARLSPVELAHEIFTCIYRLSWLQADIDWLKSTKAQILHTKVSYTYPVNPKVDTVKEFTS